MLTRKQYELLMFIHERVRETGIPPSFDEMKEALDLKSKSGIHRLITALEERGFLRRMEKRARALEVLKLPDNMAETLRPATTRSQAQRATAQRAICGPERPDPSPTPARGAFGPLRAISGPLRATPASSGVRLCCCRRARCADKSRRARRRYRCWSVRLPRERDGRRIDEGFFGEGHRKYQSQC